MKNVMKKIADLSTSFDKAGLTVESAKLDGLLRSLTEEMKSAENKKDAVKKIK